MKKLLLLGALFMFSASIYSFDFSSGNEKGKVTLYRSGTITALLFDFEVTINQSAMFKVKRKDIVELTLNPGVYLIHVSGWKDPLFGVFKIEVKAGEESFYRITPGSTYMTAPGKEYKFEKVDEIDDVVTREYIDSISWVRGEE